LTRQNYKKLLPFLPTYKITVLGGSNVGKTALIDTFVSGKFKGKYPLTLHDESFIKILDSKYCCPFKLNIMDTVG
jgi:GTPase SAR1 family protein